MKFGKYSKISQKLPNTPINEQLKARYTLKIVDIADKTVFLDVTERTAASTFQNRQPFNEWYNIKLFLGILKFWTFGNSSKMAQ